MPALLVIALNARRTWDASSGVQAPMEWREHGRPRIRTTENAGRSGAADPQHSALAFGGDRINIVTSPGQQRCGRDRQVLAELKLHWARGSGISSSRASAAP